MRKFKLFLTASAILFSCFAAIAQSSVSGKVTSAEDGQPVIGATVYVEGTMLGTVSDADGNFTLTGIPASAQSNPIVVACIGYEHAKYHQQSFIAA